MDNRKNQLSNNNFCSEVRTRTKNINRYMESGNSANTNAEISYVLNTLLPSYSGNRVQPNDWMLHTKVQFIQYQICLLACCHRPLRCLAVIIKSSGGNEAKEVLPELHYSLIKIVAKTSKRKPEASVLCLSNLLPGKLITTRRGFYAIHVPTFNEKLSAVLIDDRLTIRKQQYDRISAIYYEWVHGMTKAPTPSFPRTPADLGIEQFLVNEYPTTAWKKHILSIETMSKSKDESEDMEEEIDVKSTTLSNPQDGSCEFMSEIQEISYCNGRFIDADDLPDIDNPVRIEKLSNNLFHMIDDFL